MEVNKHKYKYKYSIITYFILFYIKISLMKLYIKLKPQLDQNIKKIMELNTKF